MEYWGRGLKDVQRALIEYLKDMRLSNRAYVFILKDLMKEDTESTLHTPIQ